LVREMPLKDERSEQGKLAQKRYGEKYPEKVNEWSRGRNALRVYGEGADSPESKCAFRKLAVKLFGPKAGWRLIKAFPISVATFFVGLGILLHDYCHALWQVGGIREVLSPQGGYLGTIILVIGFILAYYQFALELRR